MIITSDLTSALVDKKDVLQHSILSWVRCHFRDYPWRHQHQSPYMILIAELLLKRTTAAAAANIYPIFIRKYPTLLHLATASEEGLRQDLTKVGLQRQRARAIIQLTQYLVDKENAILPSSLERLVKIPGLGRYSARAILSFGFNDPTGVVDANVERVIKRVFWEVIPVKPSRSLLQEIADTLLVKDAHQQFNFGLLDLGAIVCRYVIPSCKECALLEICDYYIIGQPELTARRISQLRRVRLAKGLPLTELAKKAGISKLTVINIEAGRTVPQPKTLQKLSDALDIKPDELVSLS